jgi:uncharacterized protein (DUF58 family)
VLTRSGLAAALAATVLALCGWWWAYEELAVVAAATAAAIGAALWSSRVRYRGRILRTIAAPRVARGDPIRATYRVVNLSRRRAAPAVILDHCDGAEVRVDLPALGTDDKHELVALIPTRRRGAFPVGPWALERVDPFGLAIGRRTSDNAGTVLVHPRIHALHGPYGAMHTVEDDAVYRRAASDPLSGFVSLREYVDGDDPRLIHWPTSARMGTLMLREHVELRRPEFTVVLDASRAVATPDDFEEMVDIVASVAVHALRTGVEVGVRTTARAFPGALKPVARETHVLDLLTPVQQVDPEAVMTLAETFRSGLDHTSIVFVTGSRGPSSAFARTANLFVVRVGRDATAPAATAVGLAVVDALDFAQRWRPWR